MSCHLVSPPPRTYCATPLSAALRVTKAREDISAVTHAVEGRVRPLGIRSHGPIRTDGLLGCLTIGKPLDHRLRLRDASKASGKYSSVHVPLIDAAIAETLSDRTHEAPAKWHLRRAQKVCADAG